MIASTGISIQVKNQDLKVACEALCLSRFGFSGDHESYWIICIILSFVSCQLGRILKFLVLQRLTAEKIRFLLKNFMKNHPKGCLKLGFA